MASKHKTDGVDVAIAAFFAARLTGDTIEEASRDAEAMLDFYGVPRRATQTPEEPSNGR